jgi:hypothetical protein
MTDFSTRNIVDYAMDADAVNFRSELYGAIHDRVAAHIEAAKQVVATNFITPETEESDFESETVESEQAEQSEE